MEMLAVNRQQGHAGLEVIRLLPVRSFEALCFPRLKRDGTRSRVRAEEELSRSSDRIVALRGIASTTVLIHAPERVFTRITTRIRDEVSRSSKRKNDNWPVSKRAAAYRSRYSTLDRYGALALFERERFQVESTPSATNTSES